MGLHLKIWIWSHLHQRYPPALFQLQETEIQNLIPKYRNLYLVYSFFTFLSINLYILSIVLFLSGLNNVYELWGEIKKIGSSIKVVIVIEETHLTQVAFIHLFGRLLTIHVPLLPSTYVLAFLPLKWRPIYLLIRF